MRTRHSHLTAQARWGPRVRSLIAILAAAAVAAVLWRYVPPAAGQSQVYRAPRTVDGRPDLNGIWQALNTAHYDLEAHPARPALALTPAPPRTGIPGLARATPVDLPAPAVRALGAAGGVPAGEGVVVGGDIPYQPWAAARKNENAAKWLERDPEIRCHMPGVPRATYMPYPFQILQGTDKILIAYEYGGTTRTIHMTEVKNNPTPTWMGLSRGRWDGDTLVVDVSDFNDQTWFDRAGNFHSEALRVVERYTPVSPYHLMYEATIEDPKVFTRPWTIRMPLYRRFEPDKRILEYKCTEFVEQFLYGGLGLVDPSTGRPPR
ncbi:MAG: hypothetical protein HYY76_08820 [Acidobacteria bacterium]|nr:hypothetical protein [Acidobacteriota bacterium]